MIRYIPEDTAIVFEEIPDEITLALNISNCQNNCEGCHSPYLRKDIGEELTIGVIESLLRNGITCICFMGEGNDAEGLQNLITLLRKRHPDVKLGLYSGRDSVVEDFYWKTLDYLKIGAFKPECGPLNKPTTNQRLYSARNLNKAIKVDGKWRNRWEDITSKFWKSKT